MAVALWVGRKHYEIGAASFLKSFFSTVFVRLEDEDWGSRFPTVMNELYMGKLPHAKSTEALSEVRVIRREFALHPPTAVVWDFENREAVAPWGDERAAHITNLSEEFVTSDGKNLFDVLEAALELSAEKRKDVDLT
jgi:2,3-bisphosphoglycerate-dependent phosphoglycerate mutase